jgi:hypothetical protein
MYLSNVGQSIVIYLNYSKIKTVPALSLSFPPSARNGPTPQYIKLATPATSGII